MDELIVMFETLIGDALQREKAMEEEFKEFEKKLNDCVSQANERGTPVQNKKRPKRQVSIYEKDEETTTSSNRNESEEQQHQKHLNDKSASVVPSRSSARMLDISRGTAHTSPSAELLQPMDIAPPSETQGRPCRSARLKAQDKLKEAPLNSKMRQDSNASIVVKTERQSTAVEGMMVNNKSIADVAASKAETTATQARYDEMETENDANYANKNRKDEGFGSTNESSEKDEPKKAIVRDASIMVIPATVPKVEILSDEEMPPPKMPPPKMAAPNVRTKKRAPKQDESIADQTASSSAVSSAESSMNSTSSSTSSAAAVRRLRARPRKASKMPEEQSSSIESSVRIKAEKLSIAPLEQQNEPVKDSRGSGKSVYEDAQEQQEQLNAISVGQDVQIRPLKIVLEKLTHPIPGAKSPHVSEMNETYSVPQHSESNGGAHVGRMAPNNDTFTVINSPPNTAPCNETFNIPQNAANHEKPPGVGVNDTFVMEKQADANAPGLATNHANASIMTEDDSVVENSPNQAPTVKPKPVVPVPAAKKSSAAPTMAGLKKSTAANANGTASARAQAQAKGNKELFNPCIMSPIKSRIQAFEKCATTAGTLTKSTIGTPQARMGRLLKTISSPSIATPQFSSFESLRPVHSAQAKDTFLTPNCALPIAPKASSTSKMQSMQSRALQHKPAVGHSGMSGSTASSSHSRESSWDRAQGTGTLSAASSTSSLLDEKKKKREEKQRLAAIQREAMEREKREHAERLLREKEEKHRKLLQEKQEKLRIDASKKAKKLEEFEKRRQMEEQRALADQKRDELARQLEQQRIDRELLDTLKQSQMKENQDTRLHKQLQQQKLRQQEQLLQQQKKKAAAAKKEAFTFEMIDTDDTTDDEEAEDAGSRKKKRPPQPEWCRNTDAFRKTLSLQAKIESKVVDRLFSVQPMTPDLRILFPSIAAYKLKRNSSAIWRTPPRYSQLP